MGFETDGRGFIVDGRAYSVTVGGTNIIDDFEDGDLAEYTEFGTVSSATVQSGTAQSGQALELTTGSSVDNVAILSSTSGLDNYPTAPVQFEFYTRYQDFARPSFLFFTQSNNQSPDRIVAEIKESGDVGIFDTSRTNNTCVGGEPIDKSAYALEWLRFKVTVDGSNNIRVELFDSNDNAIITPVEFDSLALSSGGIQWYSLNAGGDTVWFDEAEIIDPNPSSLSVTSQPLDDIQAWYSLNRGAFIGGGSAISDFASGNDLGTVSGGTWTTDSKYGPYALDFDGVDDVMEGPSVLGDPSALTVSCWWKSDTKDSFGGIVGQFDSQDTSSADEKWLLQQRDDANGQHRFLITDGNSNFGVANADVPVDTWTHLAGTWDGSTVRIYKNATQVDSSSFSTINSNSIPIKLGQYTNSAGEFYADGTLDDVRIYDRALSGSEIQTIYDNTV